MRIVIEIDGETVTATTVQPNGSGARAPRLPDASFESPPSAPSPELLKKAAALGATSAGPAAVHASAGFAAVSTIATSARAHSVAASDAGSAPRSQPESSPRSASTAARPRGTAAKDRPATRSRRRR